MGGSIVIIGERMEDLLFAMDRVRAMGYVPLAIRTKDVARRALDIRSMPSRALVLYLTERDNLADLRSALSVPGLAVLLVAPTSPPRAALARLAAEFDAGLCSREDAAVVREALLVALTAQREHAAHA